MTKVSVWKMARVVFLFCAATAVDLSAQTFTKIADFDGANGANPDGMSPIQGPDGNFYGTTAQIDDDGGGTIFKITPGGSLTLLYSFCSKANCVDGFRPFAGLVLSTDGNLYGTTSGGGTQGSGTVFKITTEGSLTTLYSFCVQFNCPDGSTPYAALIQAPDGTFYGTTGAGGPSRLGTIFRITSGGALTTLHSFDGSDGSEPFAALTEGVDGIFYGTTAMGGSGNYGTVFKITSSGVLTTLNTLGFGAGSYPTASLIQAPNGDFYGTTSGDPNGRGTIFKMTRRGTLTTLHDFCVQEGCTDGANPTTPMVLGSDWNLYGTTADGGDPTCFGGCGTIYEFGRTGKLNSLYGFCMQSNCTDGSVPVDGLFQATNGVFYGTTSLGGAYDLGTVFSLDMGLAPFITFVRAAGKVGQLTGVLGQGFTGTTGVSFNGIPASFTVKSETFLEATVPVGATTGYVTAITPAGTLASKVPFYVIP
jgi:uncharacterized repeat protein (TIGR03803 family)